MKKIILVLLLLSFQCFAITPIEWTKCENDADMLAPEIGSAWTLIGSSPSYLPGKWGNGIQQDSANYWYDLFAVGLTQFSLTFSCIMSADNNTFTMLFDDLSSGGNVQVYLYGGQFAVNYWSGIENQNFTTPTWGASDIVDFAFVFDDASSPHARVFTTVNNGITEEETRTYAYNDSAFGNYSGFNFMTWNAGYANHIVDNIKLWSSLLTLSQASDAAHFEGSVGPTPIARRQLHRLITN